jgi:glycerol-3-phosphate acyltransferase PlsY
MSPLLFDLLLVIAGYLCGSIPNAVLVARAHGVDIFKAGSGNPGATNVGRTLGRFWGLFVFVADALKGLTPVLLARFLVPNDQVGLPVDHEAIYAIVGFAAILGHLASVFTGFRGGKGVATALGVVIGISPLVVLISGAVFGLVTLLTRYVSLASILGVLVAIPVSLVLREPISLVAFYSVAAALIIFRHRANIGRLLNGTESKLGVKKPNPDEPIPPASESQT